jgi:hypothetical protein
MSFFSPKARMTSAGPPTDVTPGTVSGPIPGTLSSEQHEGQTCTEADLSSLT